FSHTRETGKEASLFKRIYGLALPGGTEIRIGRTLPDRAFQHAGLSGGVPIYIWPVYKRRRFSCDRERIPHLSGYGDRYSGRRTYTDHRPYGVHPGNEPASGTE